MYHWLIFLHVLSVFGFLFAHGASAVVIFKVRAERDPARILALLDLSNWVGDATRGMVVLLLLTGIVAGFSGGWWGRGWIWAALALFLAISTVMSLVGRPYVQRIRHAIEGARTGDREMNLEPQPLPPDALAAVLGSGRPALLAGIGLGGLAVITWLMMFKPF